MQEAVNEKVIVAAVFGDSHKKISPIWFIWRGNKYKVKKVTYIWSERKGNITLYHFSVYDGINLYDLIYNASSLVWSLGSVDMEG